MAPRKRQIKHKHLSARLLKYLQQKGTFLPIDIKQYEGTHMKAHMCVMCEKEDHDNIPFYQYDHLNWSRQKTDAHLCTDCDDIIYGDLPELVGGPLNTFDDVTQSTQLIPDIEVEPFKQSLKTEEDGAKKKALENLDNYLYGGTFPPDVHNKYLHLDLSIDIYVDPTLSGVRSCVFCSNPDINRNFIRVPMSSEWFQTGGLVALCRSCSDYLAKATTEIPGAIEKECYKCSTRYSIEKTEEHMRINDRKINTTWFSDAHLCPTCTYDQVNKLHTSHLEKLRNRSDRKGPLKVRDRFPMRIVAEVCDVCSTTVHVDFSLALEYLEYIYLNYHFVCDKCRQNYDAFLSIKQDSFEYLILILEIKEPVGEGSYFFVSILYQRRTIMSERGVDLRHTLWNILNRLQQS